MEETETGAKTMPTTRPRLRSPGSSSTAYRESAGAAATSPAATAHDDQPGGRDGTGAEVGQQVARHDGADRDSQGEGQEGDARSQVE